MKIKSADSRHGNTLIEGCLMLKKLAHSLRASKYLPFRFLGYGISVIYRVISLYVVGFDIPTSVRLGSGVLIYHGQGLVVNDRAIIGNRVILRQNTTIGANDGESDAPVVCDGADLGANVVVLGPISIGEGAVVGAGSVVIKNIQAHEIVAGNPARSIGMKSLDGCTGCSARVHEERGVGNDQVV
ncbi:serine O-acetyltransferase [Kocuria rosea]|uniref:serine O-acetyltransferase n=1 Tax=Kocuria rosea TaxID=1275 RepID=UPI0025401B0B|nr:hypothetical protein [Kocuria rosea]WIG16365.1 hypothetical protein QOY29_11840 [Kocuria rosea]